MKDTSIIVSLNKKEELIAKAALKFPEKIKKDGDYWFCLTEYPDNGDIGFLHSRIDLNPTIFLLGKMKYPKFKFVIFKEMSKTEYSCVIGEDEFRVDVIDKNHKILVFVTAEFGAKYHLIHDIIQMPPINEAVYPFTEHKIEGTKTKIAVKNEPHLVFYHWAINALKHALIQFIYGGDLYSIPGNKIDELFSEVDNKDKTIGKLTKIRIKNLGDYITAPF